MLKQLTIIPSSLVCSRWSFDVNMLQLNCIGYSIVYDRLERLRKLNFHSTRADVSRALENRYVELSVRTSWKLNSHFNILEMSV